MTSIRTAPLHRVDPSKTGPIRRRFERELMKRFDVLKGKVDELVAVEDAFGLAVRATVATLRRPNSGSGNTQNDRFAFLEDSEKLRKFSEWLAAEVANEIVTVPFGQSTEQAFWTQYIWQSYQKGMERAFVQINKSGDSFIGTGDFFDGSRSEFLRQSFGHPVSVDKVKTLAGRVLTDLQGVTSAMETQMKRELIDGITQGLSPKQVARNLADRVEKIGKTRARAIAQTELMRSFSEGQLDGMERLGVDEIGVMSEWSTSGLGTTAKGNPSPCPLCAPLEGVMFTVEEARGLLPRHPNCVTGDMVIHAPDSVAVMRAEYTGEIFDFSTSFGTRLSVTANHILLTQRGWVFAKDVTDSDYFVNSFNSAFSSVTPDDYLAHPNIREVFRSALELVNKDRVIESLCMPEYFHGDGESIDSEVKIVNLQGELRSDGKVSQLAEFKELAFNVGSVASVDSLRLERLRSETLSRSRLARATDSLMGSLGITSVLLARSATHVQPIGLSLLSNSNSPVDQQVDYGLPGNSVLLMESENAGAAQVQFDELIKANMAKVSSVRSRHVVSLPVYDVSTESTVYSIGGVLSSNCRCVWIPSNIVKAETGPAKRFYDPKSGKVVIRKVRPKKSKAQVEAQIRKSLEAGRGKKKSTWLGADAKISKSRPKFLTGD